MAPLPGNACKPPASGPSRATTSDCAHRDPALFSKRVPTAAIAVQLVTTLQSDSASRDPSPTQWLSGTTPAIQTPCRSCSARAPDAHKQQQTADRVQSLYDTNAQSRC